MVLTNFFDSAQHTIANADIAVIAGEENAVAFSEGARAVVGLEQDFFLYVVGCTSCRADGLVDGMHILSAVGERKTGFILLVHLPVSCVVIDQSGYGVISG